MQSQTEALEAKAARVIEAAESRTLTPAVEFAFLRALAEVGGLDGDVLWIDGLPTVAPAVVVEAASI